MNNKVFIYRSETMTPNGITIEENYENFYQSVSNIRTYNRTKPFKGSSSYGLIDWEDASIKNIQEHYKLRTAVAFLIRSIAKRSAIKEFDQVLCMFAPRMEEIVQSKIRFGNLENYLNEINMEKFLIGEFRKNNLTAKKTDMQLLENTCTSGNSLLSFGYQGIKLKKWNSVLVIAVDLVDLFGLEILDSFGALANSEKYLDAARLRPFDLERSGFVKSDGAACAVLTGDQKYEFDSMAEILSFAQTSDAYKLTDGREDVASVKECMRMAIERSGLSYDQIDIVKAHGTGTGLNDKHESTAIMSLFNQKHRPHVTSLKGHIGHVTDASGLVETAIMTHSINNGHLIEIRNLEKREFDLNFVTEKQLKISKPHVNILANSLGFGGNNCSLVLSCPTTFR